MAFCTTCGVPVQPGQNYCTECGAKLAHPKDVTARGAAQAQPVFGVAAGDGQPVPLFGMWQGEPARGAADPFAEFLLLTERLLAGGATNEETYTRLSDTFTNLKAQDAAGQQLLEQGRDSTAQASLSNAFFLWALHTIYHAF